MSRETPKVAPADNVEAPRAMSQTLLKHADRCPRSAYLYLKHRGGPGAEPLHRGSLFHLFAARLMVELVQRGEKSLLVDREDHAALWSLTQAMMDGVLDEHPELTVRASEMDVLRACAFHLGVGLDVDPQTVAGVERRFEMDVGDVTIVGIVDLVSYPDAVTALVDDYKTSMHVLTQEEYRETIQSKIYALLVAEGHPVTWEDCPDCYGSGVERHHEEAGYERCSSCKGKKGGWRREDCIGGHLRYVRTREIYPRVALRPNGTLTTRERTLSRLELTEFRGDLERIVARVTRGVETGDWPALAGTWCTECPAEPECPLPSSLRRYAGQIQSVEQAQEALEWVERISDRVNATRAEVRAFAKALGEPIVVGDRVYEFKVSHSRGVARTKGKGWEPLEEAIERAARYGEPFALDEWLKWTTKSEFKARPKGEQDDDGGRDGGAGEPADGRTAGERWGDEAPF